MLEFMDEPKRLQQLQELGAQAGFDADRALAELNERELFWYEGDRFLGLVLGERAKVTL